MKSANALVHSLQVTVGSCCISEEFLFVCAHLLAVSADAVGDVAHTSVLNPLRDCPIHLQAEAFLVCLLNH